MQPHQSSRTEATIVHIADVEPGDYFYLCTDGMLERMDDAALMSIFADDSTTDEQKRQQLIDATVDNADNHSAYLIHVNDVVEDKKEPVLDLKPAPKRKTSLVKTVLFILFFVFALLAVILVFLNL
jgi:protein phosphatase